MKVHAGAWYEGLAASVHASFEDMGIVHKHDGVEDMRMSQPGTELEGLLTDDMLDTQGLERANLHKLRGAW